MGVRIPGIGDPLVLASSQPRQIPVDGVVVGRPLRASETVPRPSLTIFRKDDAQRRRLLFVEEREQPIRYDETLDGLGRKRGPQAEDGGTPSACRRHVPHRRHAPLAARDRLPLSGDGIELQEIEDAVLERARSSHHRGPDERRERGRKRRHLAARAFGDEAAEVRHDAARDVAVEQSPVGGVESEKNHRVTVLRFAGDVGNRGGRAGRALARRYAVRSAGGRRLRNQHEQRDDTRRNEDTPQTGVSGKGKGPRRIEALILHERAVPS